MRPIDWYIPKHKKDSKKFVLIPELISFFPSLTFPAKDLKKILKKKNKKDIFLMISKRIND